MVSLVGDEARLGLQDRPAADGLEAVLPHGGARGRDIGDDVRVAHGGSNLQGAAGLYQQEVADPVVQEEAAHQPGIPGGDAEIGVLFAELPHGHVRQVGQGGDVDPGVGHSHLQLAVAVAKLGDHDVGAATLASHLQEAVPSDDAQVGAPLLNHRRHVRVAQEDHLHTRQGGYLSGVAARVGPGGR